MTSAKNGLEVMRLLREEKFDIILMDVQMPIMDGLTTTKAIRSGLTGTVNKDIPIIALTAYAMADDKDKFLKAGMDAYLAKPIDIGELMGVIRQDAGGASRRGLRDSSIPLVVFKKNLGPIPTGRCCLCAVRSGGHALGPNGGGRRRLLSRRPEAIGQIA